MTPVLSGLRLQASDDGEPRVSVAMHDNEISNLTDLVVDVVEPGVTLVNGRLLVDIAKSLPNQPLEVVAEGTRMELRCGRTRFELPTLPAEDYPALPEMPPRCGTVPGPVLAGAVSQVAVAAAREENLQHLTGVLLEVSGETVTLAATDRYRLAMRTLTWTPQEEGLVASALVPARTLQDAAKSLAAADEVHLALDRSGQGTGLLGIEGMARRSTTRQISGTFPTFRRLLPPTHTTEARVETLALVEAVKRVTVVERSSAVKLRFRDDELVLEAGSGDDQVGTDAIECRTEGAPMGSIAFNPGYLLEGLHAVGRPVTNMAFTEPGKPAVLTGAADMTARASDDYLYLLMPIRLSA
jgi:DNA polymerase-3 subunit beta